MAYIRISEDNKIVEVSPVPDNEDIFNYYVSGIAERFIKVDLPEGVKIGWTYENGVFIEPPPLLGDRKSVV